MNNNSYIKQFIDNRFFDMPQSKIKSFFASKRLNLIDNKIQNVKPFIYICNKTNKFDKFLVGHVLQTTHVFLKDSVVQKMNNGSLLKKEFDNLLAATEILRKAMISIVVFPEQNPTAFGNFEPISHSISEYFRKSKFNLRFLELVGTFFAEPIWADKKRNCHTKVLQQAIIQNKDLAELSADDANSLINNHLPSSASIYFQKHSLKIFSNTRADGLDKIVYLCPKCNTFFSVYSEFNCLKCKNCGSAIEISDVGEILFSNNVGLLEELKDYQFDALSSLKLDKKLLVSYPEIEMFNIFGEESESQKFVNTVSFKIFSDRFQINKNTFEKIFNFKEIETIILKPFNMIQVTLKTGEKFGFKGKHHENLYILLDLFKLNQKKH